MVNDNEYEGRLADLVSARALHPDMAAPDGVTPAQWKEVGRLADIENILFDDAHGAPPLHLDPVAAMLGLVPDPHLSLDGPALARVRKAAGVAASELAKALSGRGWHVSTGDVLRWQTKRADDVSPALLKVIATELGSTVEQLTVDRSSADESAALVAVTSSSAFAALVDRFARVRGVTASVAASTLRSRAIAAAHRGQPPTTEEWLLSLDAFVSALEDND